MEPSHGAARANDSAETIARVGLTRRQHVSRRDRGSYGD